MPETTPEDTFSDRLEEEIRDRLLANSDLAPLKVVFRGDPGGIVPVEFYPYAIVFITLETEAQGEGNYVQETGPVTPWRRDGFINISTLVPDARTMRPGVDRKSDVGSYVLAKTLIQAAKQTLQAWGGPNGMEGIEADPVVSEDGLERTSELRIDAIRNGLQQRGPDNASNESVFEFHFFSRRDDS